MYLLWPLWVFLFGCVSVGDKWHRFWAWFFFYDCDECMGIEWRVHLNNGLYWDHGKSKSLRLCMGCVVKVKIENEIIRTKRKLESLLSSQPIITIHKGVK